MNHHPRGRVRIRVLVLRKITLKIFVIFQPENQPYRSFHQVCRAKKTYTHSRGTLPRTNNQRVQVDLVMLAFNSRRTFFIHDYLERTIIVSHFTHRPNRSGKHRTLRRGSNRREGRRERIRVIFRGRPVNRHRHHLKINPGIICGKNRAILFFTSTCDKTQSHDQ